MRSFPAFLGVALLAIGPGAGCASWQGAGTPRFDFFVPAGGHDDVWFEKVGEWQSRARREALIRPLGEVAPPGPSPIEAKMAAFAAAERRALALAIARWSRRNVLWHYQADPSQEPAYDHWPTVAELLQNGGDDCDGLDLVPYQLLLEFGFPPDEVFRMIVRREESGANHMVTLWFEDREDPWVLDATGAMVRDMQRFSTVSPDFWTPVKIFNEREQYSVAERGRSAAEIARD